jgi:hypothetical protein
VSAEAAARTHGARSAAESFRLISLSGIMSSTNLGSCACNIKTARAPGLRSTA